MLRRQLLLSVAAGAAALSLGGCEWFKSGTGETNVQSIIDWLKDKCGFLTDAQSVIKVILTIVSAVNAEAGGAAVVINSVAEKVQNLICDAVNQKIAATSGLRSAAKGATENISLAVNGVEIKGQLTKK